MNLLWGKRRCGPTAVFVVATIVVCYLSRCLNSYVSLILITLAGGHRNVFRLLPHIPFRRQSHVHTGNRLNGIEQEQDWKKVREREGTIYDRQLIVTKRFDVNIATKLDFKKIATDLHAYSLFVILYFRSLYRYSYYTIEMLWNLMSTYINV